jgi:hypothetical protein
MRTIVNSSKTFRDEDKLESSIEILNMNSESGIVPNPSCCSHANGLCQKCRDAVQTGREVSVGKLQCFGEELLVPSGALSLSLDAVGGGMMP